ncbi:COG2958 family protein [Larkinella terrae]|uniref:HrgA protein n=1 Tax=Larkinella terrae TaxID=2025311 RepID=A0A7K0EMM7_9BACT|nr:HrgA protein [Larkinella terrae]MRS63100.1 HrgA protein [Larkinella terrae]
MSLNLVHTVTEFLKSSPDNKFTARQIAEWIYQTYPDECRKKQEQSRAIVIPLNTEAALLQQLVAEISSQSQRLQKKYPQVKTTEGRPRRYYFTSKTDQAEIDALEAGSTDLNLLQELPTTKNEQSLYPKLAEYLFTELGVYSKRIDEKKSSNNRGPGGNKWLYPDLVGMEDLSREWHSEIRECVKQYADRKTKLWSFEVKLLVNRSNVREVFFQAVSNSSWANLGYLVAAEIEGRETIKELLMLTSLHGIGVIRLNADNPAESEILIPAKERSDVDWNTANRLVKENRDFINYIELVRQFYQTGNLKNRDWDYAE